MRIVMFYHSLISDWNHGNAHFLRGVAAELRARGHGVLVFEPADGWSLTSLVAEQGQAPVLGFQRAFPELRSTAYRLETLDLDAALSGADLVLVHEWNDPALVAAVGRHRAAVGGYRLLFHDTHHRSVSERDALAETDLSHYDGVLAFGDVIRERYLAEGWADRVWTWHEAADARVFHPVPEQPREGDLVWIGNWGDGERAAELEEFLIGPAAALGLRARVYGVRYPPSALDRLSRAGIEYAGWLPNYQVPDVFARYAVTVHVPRRPYVEALPGIPTIRVFEALACGIPLVSAPWEDFLVARDGDEMREHLRHLLADPDAAERLAAHGQRTIAARHTCRHRVDQLLAITHELAEAPR
jgi:spore maturation protein CgeB